MKQKSQESWSKAVKEDGQQEEQKEHNLKTSESLQRVSRCWRCQGIHNKMDV